MKPNEPVDSSVAVKDLDDASSDEPAVASDHDEIATEAYARYVARGGGDGGDVADWLEAEEALRRTRTRSR